MNTQDFLTYQMNQNLFNSAAYIEECPCCKPVTNEEMWLTLGWIIIYMVVISIVTLAIGLAVIWIMEKFSKMMD